MDGSSMDVCILYSYTYTSRKYKFENIQISCHGVEIVRLSSLSAHKVDVRRGLGMPTLLVPTGKVGIGHALGSLINCCSVLEGQQNRIEI